MNVFEQILKRFKKIKGSDSFANMFISDVIRVIKEVENEHNNGWIPVEERLPDTNDYILLAFSNFTIPVVGRYEIDEDGNGAFYIGDELETCLSQDLFVSAWQQLPKPYKESEEE